MSGKRSSLEDLSRCNSTQVCSRWVDIAREVQAKGGVAIIQGDRVEMVLLSADEYNRLTMRADLRTRVDVTAQRAILDRLTAQFDAELAALQEPGAADRLDDMLASKGQGSVRAKAGPSY